MVRVTKVVNEDLTVDACKVDETFIHYKCPCCRNIHKHGSNGNFSRRTETRVPHCRIHRGTVFIRICDDTKGVAPVVEKHKHHKNTKYITIHDIIDRCQKYNLNFEDVIDGYEYIKIYKKYIRIFI
jgi:hypothetical protein